MNTKKYVYLHILAFNFLNLKTVWIVNHLFLLSIRDKLVFWSEVLFFRVSVVHFKTYCPVMIFQAMTILKSIVQEANIQRHWFISFFNIFMVFLCFSYDKSWWPFPYLYSRGQMIDLFFCWKSSVGEEMRWNSIPVSIQ